MSKKIILISSLIIVVVVIVVKMTGPKPMKTLTDFTKSKSSQQKSQKVEDYKKSMSKPNDKEKRIHIPETQLDPETLSEEEISEFEDYFEEVEKNWISRIETLFVSEFSFTEEKLEAYMNLRDKYEEEKMIAFQEFNEFMVSKYGENYSYNPTEDMERFENKVSEIYQEKMKKLVGEENYKRYLEVLKEYNERLRREQDPDKGVILIEL